jgi:hypothetical protein
MQLDEYSFQPGKVFSQRPVIVVVGVSNFSAVDGCVVLTHDLEVVSFGAKIQVSPEESKATPRRFKHIQSGTVYDDEDFMRAIGGTRHQSVARLCQAYGWGAPVRNADVLFGLLLALRRPDQR